MGTSAVCREGRKWHRKQHAGGLLFVPPRQIPSKTTVTSANLRLQAIMTDPTDTAVCMGFDRSIAPKHDSGSGYYGFDTIFITW